MAVTAIVFNAGQEEYAIPVQFVISIEKYESVNPVPHLPDYISGVVKSRGELIPVLDLGFILYNRHIQYDTEVRMIVIQTEELSFALLVNEAKEILEIPENALQQMGLIAYHKTKYFSSIANLDQRIITMIDPVSMLEVLEGVKEIKDYLNEQKQKA
ncbi:chemotaxis protein CheW [Lederbergia wuyishanensis]|uniref:Purine-binding chemotaxis protein CheW n=1 Tax=Lederbergia wuyishanensis TaxID=1347903 RepID=A0ABU0D156_9BACI|nr:CheW domain-containing protein [Lederbergia wuyishanensis]MCJ8006761.1 chemotaxis protein CheW [Lederbergia wuyishanensis]MDQ0342143.1 purine-binding chemotaxis protein CheW [Lederbergia wuyishanensis]